MVQNDQGVYAQQITKARQSISAESIKMGTADSDTLKTFEGCKVWIELTEDRITTAKQAVYETPIASVAVTGIESPAAGTLLDKKAVCDSEHVAEILTVTYTVGTDEEDSDTARANRVYCANVTLKPDTNYGFTSSTEVTMNQKAASKKLNDDGTITIRYSFPKTKAKVLEKTYYVSKEELTDSFGLNTGDTGAKLVFGTDPNMQDKARTWYVAGMDGKDRLAVLSASEFGQGKYGDNANYSESDFVKAGENSYFTTYLDPVQRYFTSQEIAKMQKTTVSTREYDQKTREVTGKLYIPDVVGDARTKSIIYVGSHNDIPVELNQIQDIKIQKSNFWLRSACLAFSSPLVYYANPTDGIEADQTSSLNSLVPAFDLDISSVLFASTAPEASTAVAGILTPGEAFTLRYQSDGSETVRIDPQGASAVITNPADNMYLVVQKEDGSAYTKQLSSTTTSVKAGEIAGTDSFNGCKVWLESTTNRITTAKPADWEEASVIITKPEGSHIIWSAAEGNGQESQAGIKGEMASIVYTAQEGYFFPEDYVSTITGLTDGSLHGVTVTRDSASQIRVSGGPTAVTTEITLPAATAKKIALTVTKMEFDPVIEGYITSPVPKKIAIANDTGNGANWNAEIGQVTLTGTDKDSFDISGNGYNWQVCPKAGLPANENGTAKTYTAEINVPYNATAGVSSPATAQVSFTVNPITSRVTVTKGAAVSGTTTKEVYAKGETITVKADAPEKGYAFDKWEAVSGDVTLKNAAEPETTFIMPGHAVEIKAVFKDVTAPVIEIKEGTKVINKALSTTTFGKFFKEAKTITIDYQDKESGLKAGTTKYYLSDKQLSTEEVNGLTSWETYDDKTAIRIEPNNKKVIYAKAEDQEGNTTVVNSDGIVIYTDAIQKTTGFTHIKGVEGAQTVEAELKGNTVKAVTMHTEAADEKTLVMNDDYTVEKNGTITLTKSYLENLPVSAKAYTLTIHYNPMGETYVEDKVTDVSSGVEKDQNQAPATTTFDIIVRKPKLLAVTAPEAITGVANGAEKTPAALGLPDKVTIRTEDATVTEAEVIWDLENLAEGTYNPEVPTEQVFKVNGNVKLSDAIDENKNSMKITVQITVDAAPSTEKPEDTTKHEDTNTSDVVKVTKVELNQSALTLIEEKSITLEATVTPDYAANKSVIWESSNTKIARVSSSGMITAVRAGKAFITCTAADGSGQKAVCEVTVKEATSKKQDISVGTSTSGTKVKVTWAKIEGADGYYIYGAKCGSTPKKLKKIKNGNTTIWIQRELEKGAVYKYTVKAYKKSGSGFKKMVSSIELHIATEGSRYTNARKVKTNFKAAALKMGTTRQIKAFIVKQNKKKPLVDHVATYRYLTSNRKVATVSADGQIKAKGKGICYIYVYANDGVFRKIRIIVT